MQDKVNKAIKRLQEYSQFTNGQGFYLAFSGGKDSIVVKALCDMAGVKYDANYNSPTIDPPELIYFIKQNHKDVIWHRPDVPFLIKVRTKGMPIRQGRWCCEFLKENGGENRFVLTGIRWEESPRRAKRSMVEHCYRGHGKQFLHPIIDWTEVDVWRFIERYKVPYCSLYDEGWRRIGCLFCPMVSAWKKQIEAERYPRYKQSFINAFQKLRDLRISQGRPSVRHWANGTEMFDWYISNLSVIKWKKNMKKKENYQYESDQEYFDSGSSRLERHKAQGQLF